MRKTRKSTRNWGREILAGFVALLFITAIVLVCWGALELVLWLTPANSKF